MKLKSFEQELLEKYKLVAGVDEVGCASLAGPIVAAAVIMDPTKSRIRGVKDSKQVPKKLHGELCSKILGRAWSIAFGSSDNKEVEELNVYYAAKLAMERAINNLRLKPNFVITDFRKLNINIPQENYVNGDEKFYIISCASLLAKNYRDLLMQKYSTIPAYGGYNFENNAGYYSPKHREGLIKYGATSLHRKNFWYVKRWTEYKDLSKKEISNLWRRHKKNDKS